MTIFIVIVIVLIIGFIIFARMGGIKHQVKFYVKNYAKLRSQGYSNDQAIQYLINFYLQGEPDWKADFMHSRFNIYVNNFDELVHDIMLFYYNIDPKYGIWKVDKGKKPVPDYIIFQQADNYLRKYKSKYGIA
jgi:hypothetical protein